MNLFVNSNSESRNGGADAAGNGVDFFCVYFVGAASASARNRLSRADLSIVDADEMPSGMGRSPQFFSARAEKSPSTGMDYGDMLIFGGDAWIDEGLDFVF